MHTLTRQTARIPGLKAAVAAASLLAAVGAQAQQNLITVKTGYSRYDTRAKTTGIAGIGVPPGSDAAVGDANTLLLAGIYMVAPNIGLELALGVPPTIKARGAGAVSFLGQVMEAKVITPTFFVNYHFGQDGDAWRPYVGLGLNYTHFTRIRSPLAEHVEMSDSYGPAVQAGVDYRFDKQWGLYASVAAIKVKSDLVAAGSTVLTTTIDFRPLVYNFGVSYRY
jgi:outer membrane protein